MLKLDLFLLFNEFDADLKARLESLIEWFPVNKGSTLIEQGAPSNFAVFVLEGSFEVYRYTEKAGTKLISSAKVGTMLGEVGLLTESPRFATCRAAQDSVVGILSKSDLISISEKDPQLYCGLLKILGMTVASRLIEINAQIESLLLKHEIAVQAANQILDASMLG